MWFIHLFTGHNWSDWKIHTYSAYAYDKEVWWSRECSCGAKQEQDSLDGTED